MTVENTIKRYEKYLEVGQLDKAEALKQHMLKSPKYEGMLGFLEPKPKKKLFSKKKKS
jgi:hypothetical protein